MIMKSGKANRRRMLAGMLALSVLCTSGVIRTGASVSAAVTVAGDVNLDGTVDAKDVTALQQYLIRKATLTVTAAENGDLNGDGVLNSVDLALLKGQVLASTPQAEATYIHLKDTSIEVEGDHATLSNSNKTVTIDASGTYYIDGTLTDGQIVVNVPDIVADAETVKLFLNGVNITGVSAAPILIENAENTSLNLVAGTTNYVYDGATYAENTAAIYAKDDMTIKGEGALVVTASTQYGIHCNNDLKITGGDITVITENTTTKMDGIRAKQSVRIKDGTVKVNATGDGIKSTKADVNISGGNVSVKAGNDAIQAETTIDISAGTLLACGDRGLTSITATNITGGSVCATATDSQAALVRASQGCMLLTYAAEWTKGNEIAVKSGATTVYAATPNKKFDYVLMSSPDLTTSAAYSLYTGGQQMKHSADAAGVFQMSADASFTGVEALNGSGTVTTEAGVQLNGSSLTVSGEGVELTSSTIATITQPGIYNVTGSMTGGQIVVNVDKTTYADAIVELVLDGIELTNTADSPIYVASVGDECRITAKNGTTSTISDGTNYTNADSDSGAIYSKDDLKIKGKGTLIVNGNYQDGIVSKDDLKIWNGSVTVNAVDDCLRGKDSVRIGDPEDTDYSALNLKLTSTSGDGIKSSGTDTGKGYVTITGGTVDITSKGGDGIQAEQTFTMNGGNVTINTYQGHGYTGSGSSGGGGGWGGGMQDGNNNKVDLSVKGIKAVGLYDTDGTTYLSGGDLIINGGTLNIDSTDDSLHCGGNMSINGGNITLASADDGMHSDHNLTIGESATGGYDAPWINITYSYEGVEGLTIVQNCGTVMVTSKDDAYNAAGGADSSGMGGGWGGGWGGGSVSGNNYSMTFNGGYTFVNAAGDGLDSNGEMIFNGGYVFVSQTGGGNGPLDCGDGYSITYNGGTVIAAGSSSMFEYPSNKAFLSTTSVSAGSTITFTNASGTVIATFTLPNASQEMVLCSTESNVSCYTGGTLSGVTYFGSQDGINRCGYGGTISGGTSVSESGGGGNRPWG